MLRKQAELKEKIGLTPAVVAFVNRAHGLDEAGEKENWGTEIGSTAEAIARLEPARFAELDEVSRRLEPPSLALEFVTGNGLSLLTNPDEGRRKAAVLLVSRAGKAGASILNDPETANEFFLRPDPEGYVSMKIALAERAKKLGATQAFRHLKSLDESRIASLESQPDPRQQKVFAQLLEEEIETVEFKQRVETWGRIMTPELWERANRSNGGDLAWFIRKARASWIGALEGKEGTEGLREMLCEPVALVFFTAGNDTAKLAGMAGGWKYEYGYLKSRQEPPIEGVDERAIREAQDVIKQSGLAPFISSRVRNIRLVRREDIRGCSGIWEPADLTVRLAVEREKPHRLASVLIHEVGHAAQQSMALVPEAQEAFDKYAVEAIFSGLRASSGYAEAYALLEGRLSTAFLSESFAEDFRILMEYPVGLPAAKREAMETVFRRLAPGLDLERAQENIRRMYGNLYGVSVKDIQEPADCASAVKMAEYIERTDRTETKNPFA